MKKNIIYKIGTDFFFENKILQPNPNSLNELKLKDLVRNMKDHQESVKVSGICLYVFVAIVPLENVSFV